MKKVELLYLTQEMVLELGISINEVMAAVEDVLAEHGSEGLENPPKIGIHPKGNAFIHAMPSYIPKLNVSGMKWVSGFSDNFNHDLPQIMGVLILNDVETGKPLAIMDSRWITAVRTAATTAITAKYCAKEDSEELGIIGAGIQGKFHALALKEVMPKLKLIKIYDVNEKAMDDYVQIISEKTGLQVKKVASYEDAVSDSDVVITATQRLENPIVEYEWLKEGVLAVGLESGRAWGDTIIKMDKFVTDDWEQTKAFAETGAFPMGIKEMYIELSQFVNQKELGRIGEKEKIFVGNVGISAADLAVGDIVYKTALKRNKGITLPLMESENILI